VTPYWRTIKAGGKLNEKYPGGAAAQAEKLIAEGHEIVPGRGKQPPKVKDWERKLVELKNM
jgi:alkylated DNA nucleotide flippase Atl1